MSIEQYKNLSAALDIQLEDEETSSNELLKDIVDQDTVIDTFIDGVLVGVLEHVAVASMLEHQTSMKKGGDGVDLRKVRLGRLKVIEGLQEMIGDDWAREFITEALSDESGNINALDALREYVEYTKSKEE